MGADWRDILTGEINRQVLQDGFHAERSTHYHRYALDFYLLALATARLTGDHRREGTLASVADRMAVALRQVTDAGGRVPLVGDDDGGEKPAPQPTKPAGGPAVTNLPSTGAGSGANADAAWLLIPAAMAAGGLGLLARRRVVR